MSEPEAFCLFQTFPAAPRQEFRVPQHYLLYATVGTIKMEAGGKVWSLPPARAAMIRADAPVQITLAGPLTACSALFSPGLIPAPKEPLVVFDMSPLARELVLACRPFGADTGPLSAYARQLFLTLAAVVAELAARPSRAVMPAAQTPELARALELTAETMADAPSFAEIAKAVALTERSLSRRFNTELGMTWREALRRLRLIRAMELLADAPVSITEAAFATGYNSLSAFNAAFLDIAGTTPSAYRAQVRDAALLGQKPARQA